MTVVVFEVLDRNVVHSNIIDSVIDDHRLDLRTIDELELDEAIAGGVGVLREVDQAHPLAYGFLESQPKLLFPMIHDVLEDAPTQQENVETAIVPIWGRLKDSRRTESLEEHLEEVECIPAKRHVVDYTPLETTPGFRAPEAIDRKEKGQEPARREHVHRSQWNCADKEGCSPIDMRGGTQRSKSARASRMRRTCARSDRACS